MRITDRTFDKRLAAIECAQAQDQADREYWAAKVEARLDEPLTRRDVLDALESVKVRYSPFHDSHTIEMLDRLMEALR